MARQYLLPHQINDDDWYTIDGTSYRVIGQSAIRPWNTDPYPNFEVLSGMQIKRLHLPVWREVRDPAPVVDDEYQGHLADGSSVQKHCTPTSSSPRRPCAGSSTGSSARRSPTAC